MIRKYSLLQTLQANKYLIRLSNLEWRRLTSTNTESQSEKFINVNVNKPTIGRTVGEYYFHFTLNYYWAMFDVILLLKPSKSACTFNNQTCRKTLNCSK
jgi:hypothetical protein